MQTKKIHKNTIRNQSGLGLIEVMVAAAIIGIISLGMGTVAANMTKIQAQANFHATLNSISSNFQKTILDANAWRNTVADPLNTALGNPFTCINANTPCTQTPSYPVAVGSESTYPAFAVIDDGNAVAGIFYQDNGTNGFTYAGQTCTTFSAAGSDDCPISYRLRMAVFCSGFASPCVNPSVIVYAILDYKPGMTGAGYPINVAKYSVSVTRVSGAYNRNDSIRLEDLTAGNTNPLTVGPCPTATKAVRQINVISTDSASNVVSVAAGVATLKAGGYICNAMATGKGVDGFSITLYIAGAAVATSPMAYASNATGGINQARITDFSINQTANFTIQIQQQCQAAGPGAQSFGSPLNFAGTNNVYAGIYCTRVY